MNAGPLTAILEEFAACFRQYGLNTSITRDIGQPNCGSVLAYSGTNPITTETWISVSLDGNHVPAYSTKPRS